MAKVGNLSPLSSVIANLSDVILWSVPTITSTTTIADFVDPFSINDIVEDTIEFSGDDASFDVVNNIKGVAIAGAFTETAGTVEFDFFVADTSLSSSSVFGGATTITSPSTSPDWISGTLNVYGGGKSVTRERAVGFVNSTLNRLFFFPSCTVSASIGENSGIWGWNVHVIVGSIDTPNLKQWMIINTDGEVEYDSNISPSSAPLSVPGVAPLNEKVFSSSTSSTKTTKSDL